MDYGFLAKKFIGVMIMPLSLVFFLAIIGLFFLFKNNIKKSKIFITSSILLLFIISYNPFANTLLKQFLFPTRAQNFVQPGLFTRCMYSTETADVSFDKANTVTNPL